MDHHRWHDCTLHWRDSIVIALLQRVSSASVEVEGETVGKIGAGLVVLLGVYEDDTAQDAEFLANKCPNLRIFGDDNDAMNLSLLDIGGAILAISQFTLCANARKGRRPSFDSAMPPEPANELYDLFCAEIEKTGACVERGVFGAKMTVNIINEGPVTIILNSRETRRGNFKE